MDAGATKRGGILGSNYKVWDLSPTSEVWDFDGGFNKALGSPITVANFCDIVLLRFLSISIRAFHHVSQLQLSIMGGDAGTTMFT